MTITVLTQENIVETMERYYINPICEECKKEIATEPYLEKKWPSIGKVELYHPKCYLLSHDISALLNG